MQAPTIDGIFQALADPTRLQVIERLSRGSAPVTELARPFQMALPSFVQHLHVLEDAGLVQSHKKGRVRTYQLAAQNLRRAEGWLADARILWEKRLDQLDTYLIQLKEKES